MTALTEKEFEAVCEQVISRIVQEAAIVMQRRIQTAGFVLTGDLMNSIHTQTVVLAKELQAEFSIGFRGYGRYKDMKKLLWGRLPPVQAMEEFVERVGLENFKYVPGYLLGARYRVLHIPDSRAINRIAWGIAKARVSMMKRSSSQKAFYNPTRGKLIYQSARRLMETLPEPVLKSLKQRFEL